MGEVAQDIMDGLLCQECGGYIDGEEPGHPRTCEDCEDESGDGDDLLDEPEGHHGEY